MIELQKQINTAKLQQINAERRRKSSRLLNTSPKDENDSKSIQVDKSVDLKPPRYTQLMKLLRKPRQEWIDQTNTKSVDYSHIKSEKIDSHFRDYWKPRLQSEILISPCKQVKYTNKVIFQPRINKRYIKEKQIQLKIKQRQPKLKSFKIHSVHFFSRQQIHHSRPSFLKYDLKIEQQPVIQQKKSQQKPIIQVRKQKKTLQPLKKVYQRLKDITPQKPKQSLPQITKIQIPKQQPQKIIRKRTKKSQVFSSKKANHLSAWTFHNIQQQQLQCLYLLTHLETPHLFLHETLRNTLIFVDLPSQARCQDRYGSYKSCHLPFII